jgi:hypothetical protein
MRGFGLICAVLVALLGVSGARAADLSPDQAALATAPTPTTQVSDLGSGDRIRAVVSGLRQSLADNGLSQALSRASDWVKELEVSWTAHRNGRTSSDINTEAEADLETITPSAAVTGKHASFASHPQSLNLGLVSFGTSGNDDQVWAIGHTQPLTSLTTSGSTDRNGSTTSERSLASHDVELGLRMPMMPWNATIAGDHYWWGVRGFGQQVEGTRVALKLSPMENVEIEGGRASDTRGSGGFVGLLYRVPLDQSK